MQVSRTALRIVGWTLALNAVLAAILWVRRSSPPPIPRTMRVDYLHKGTATEEHFSVDRVVLEPASARVLYSRGFASVYGEWETTAEAKQQERTFSESFRFPAPAGPVEIRLKKRDASNAFADIWNVVVDPKPVQVAAPPSPGPLLELEKHGPSADKVDFLILGDGYTAAERG